MPAPQVLRSPGVFLSGRTLPYIFMEWNLLGRDGNCPDLGAFIDLMEAEGYGARDAATLGAVDRWSPNVGWKIIQSPLYFRSCLLQPMENVLWVHSSALKIWREEVKQACQFEASVR